MSNKWRKVKMALGNGMCLHLPQVAGDSTTSTTQSFSPLPPTSNCRQSTPTHSVSSPRVSKSGSRSSKVSLSF
ncbi:uncharacterized protein E5676_scaffold84G00040 [Cucumis melo var. makuwa]|uniref:Uncharacterized protein n=1 Tax=Cucumis melo var. makuwa TaxID=1194695 RepID=A0A5A7SZJ2_CUCMM|nr:uncharacterized protein E6C27_scaffold228G001600 [Cucumis melo var. makuwa]TYK14282.1 uncharacterized protein E5676_scaffold84G00040 [Cucumis melo var. makuwa]